MSREEYLKELETIKRHTSPEQENMIQAANEAYRKYDRAMEQLGYPNKIKNKSKNQCFHPEEQLR